MKTPLPLLAAALVAGFLSSCASPSTPQTRIAKNPATFQSLPQKQQALVEQGKISQGMNKEAVLIAWGRPGDITKGETNGVPYERWTWFSLRPVVTQTIGMRFGYGGPRYCSPYSRHGRRGMWGNDFGYSGTDIDYVSVPARRVDFRSGVVKDWETRAQ